MRAKAAQIHIASLTNVQQSDRLSPKQWTISCRRNAKFAGKAELDEHLEEIADLPTFKQNLEYDPRILDAAMWRDGLRTQYRCLELGLNIHSLHLQHTPA